MCLTDELSIKNVSATCTPANDKQGLCHAETKTHAPLFISQTVRSREGGRFTLLIKFADFDNDKIFFVCRPVPGLTVGRNRIGISRACGVSYNPTENTNTIILEQSNWIANVPQQSVIGTGAHCASTRLTRLHTKTREVWAVATREHLQTKENPRRLGNDKGRESLEWVVGYDRFDTKAFRVANPINTVLLAPLNCRLLFAQRESGKTFCMGV